MIKIKYEEHPSFQFENPPWEISSTLLDEFCGSYIFIKDKGQRLPPKIILKAQNECSEALNEVFAHLKRQTETERHKAFLHELHNYAQILLEDDVAYFTRVTGFKANNVSKCSLKGAYQLCHQKYFTGQLSQEAVNRILVLSRSTLEEFRKLAQAGRTTREDLSVNRGPLVGEISYIIGQEFDRLGVNDAVSLFMSQNMKASGIALELSVPTAVWWRNSYKELTREPKTQYFHYDESPAFPKAIVYLTDVCSASGPTSIARSYLLDKTEINPIQILVGRIFGKVGRSPESCLAKHYHHIYHQSLGCPLFREDFMFLPSLMRWNSHFGWDVIPGSVLEQNIVGDEHKIIGQAGTFLVFDGSQLLHRGGLVENNERIALQVIFSPVSRVSRVKSFLRGIKYKFKQTHRVLLG
jgi:hypothetical protein